MKLDDAIPDRPLCACFQVSASRIEKQVRLGRLKTVAAITAATRAGGGCQSCHPDLEALLARCARRQYTIHIPLEEYQAAHRASGAPLPTKEELAANPPLQRGI
jgi:NifU-like protein